MITHCSPSKKSEWLHSFPHSHLVPSAPTWTLSYSFHADSASASASVLFHQLAVTQKALPKLKLDWYQNVLPKPVSSSHGMNPNTLITRVSFTYYCCHNYAPPPVCYSKQPCPDCSQWSSLCLEVLVCPYNSWDIVPQFLYLTKPPWMETGMFPYASYLIEFLDQGCCFAPRHPKSFRVRATSYWLLKTALQCLII